jgi:hypothetical protein
LRSSNAGVLSKRFFFNFPENDDKIIDDGRFREADAVPGMTRSYQTSAINVAVASVGE